ncbi:MAG: hypothetical protein NW220_02190 [Leptolyngbyaceae cyanobacterium bins.349]|nr:hypothetical protein [Leptolyngbyaceae cyanobacterium bins.349]
MNATDAWYVVKQDAGNCEIVSATELTTSAAPATTAAKEQWGPYSSKGEAIARRVGLIRAGKCQPI